MPATPQFSESAIAVQFQSWLPPLRKWFDSTSMEDCKLARYLERGVVRNAEANSEDRRPCPDQVRFLGSNSYRLPGAQGFDACRLLRPRQWLARASRRCSRRRSRRWRSKWKWPSTRLSGRKSCRTRTSSPFLVCAAFSIAPGFVIERPGFRHATNSSRSAPAIQGGLPVELLPREV